ncbi:MAG: histidine kinase N-terminal 7TM domain-containing protein [Chloroflexota bacterium]
MSSLNPYTLIPLFSGLIASALCVYALRRFSFPGSRWLALMMAAIAVYNLGYACELRSSTLEQMLFWIRIEYIGIPFIPVGWLLLGFYFTRRENWIKPWVIAALSAEALFIILMVYTNSQHYLYYAQVAVDNSGAHPLLAFRPGPVYVFHSAYVLTVNLFGVALLLLTLRQAKGIYRRQLQILTAGALVPFLVLVLYLSGLSSGLHLDLNPIGFFINGIVMAWGVFGYQLLDLAPLARERIIEDLTDGVLVFDREYRLLDCNPLAQTIFSWERAPIAQAASEIFTANPVILQKLMNPAGEISEIEVSTQQTQRTYELTVSILTDTLNHLSGVILLLHDITERKRIQTAERQQRALADALRTTAAALNSTLDVEQVLDRILDNLDRVVPYEAVDILWVEGDKALLVRRRGRPTTPPNQPQLALSIAGTPNLQRMALTRQPYLIQDVTHDPDWLVVPGAEWVRAFLGAPICTSDRVLGFIHALSAIPGQYSQLHAQGLAGFADQAAIALENARLYQEVQQAKETAEKAVLRMNEEIKERIQAEKEMSVAKEAAEFANARLVEALSRLEQMAITDKLTGAFNRHKFEEILTLEIPRSRRTGRPFGLLMMDLDHLKEINDRFGHEVGDQVLQEFIQLIQANIRAGDVAFRWGGDEFIILAPEINLEQGAILGEKLRQLVADRVFAEGARTTISVGVAAFHSTDTLDSLVKRADDALYSAKRAGRNCVAVESNEF